MNGVEIPTTSCWSESEVQDCYDKLGNLDPLGMSEDGEGNITFGDVYNVCQVRDVEG